MSTSGVLGCLPYLHRSWGSKPGPCAYKDSTPLAVPLLGAPAVSIFSCSFRAFPHVWPGYRQQFLLNGQAHYSKGSTVSPPGRRGTFLELFVCFHCGKQGLVILHTHPHSSFSELSPSTGAPLSLQISQLNALITLLIGNLSAGDRMKIMTICTIDVHARDVVAKMITAKAGAPTRAPGAGEAGVPGVVGRAGNRVWGWPHTQELQCLQPPLPRVVTEG